MSKTLSTSLGGVYGTTRWVRLHLGLGRSRQWLIVGTTWIHLNGAFSLMVVTRLLCDSLFLYFCSSGSNFNPVCCTAVVRTGPEQPLDSQKYGKLEGGFGPLLPFEQWQDVGRIKAVQQDLKRLFLAIDFVGLSNYARSAARHAARPPGCFCFCSAAEPHLSFTMCIQVAVLSIPCNTGDESLTAPQALVLACRCTQLPKHHHDCSKT